LAFSYWFDKPWFLTEGKLLLCSSYLSLGVPNWSVIYISTPALSSYFLAPLPGRKKTSARRVSHAHPLLCFKFCFTLFLLASFYQNTKKISFLFSCFYLSAFSFVRMSNPEVEVRTFKQQGGEILKYAWYRISNSHHRCTKKHFYHDPP
jgi:hypothetical protein